MLGWSLLGILPLVMLSAVVFGYMVPELRRRHLPNSHTHKVGRMAAVTLLKTFAEFQYPRRLETARLVMY